MSDRSDHDYSDFVEAHYRTVLRAAATQYRFIAFTEFAEPGRLCLWRHDIDFSPHRARRLAEIEAEAGITATYFVNVHSDFYNALEPTCARLIGEIVAMGHRLGLHFDAGFHAGRARAGADAEATLAHEQRLLESTFGVAVECYSIHNPSLATGWQGGDTRRAGMVNAYSDAIATRFTYVSDSNGIWRHQRLADVIAAAPECLHVLTHPGWWTPDAMSPRDRISRCIDGRARAQHEAYDRFMAATRRPNVGAARRGAGHSEVARRSE